MKNLLKVIINKILYLIKLKLISNKINVNYSGNNIFITGANSGIGLGLTQKFLELNNRVFATYKDNCENLTKINDKNLVLIKCNQKNLDEIENIKSKINNVPINLIINNTGIWGPKEQNFETLDFRTFQDVLMVNSLSVIKIAQVILDSTVKNSLKMIVNISAIGGSIERNNSGSGYMYKTSKTALNAITKNMAVDLLKSNNIIVFALHPGGVKTKSNPGGALGADKCANLIIKLIVNKGKGLSGKFVDLFSNEIPW